MFGLSFSSCQLIQGPAVRTWNRVAHFANLLWIKFNHVRHPIMPRSRRRHHSRSRTRSRSHSYDRDREPKRRKIESYESPQHNKRSLSSDKTHRSRQYDRGSTVERRYKRSKRRSPASKKRHRHRHEKSLSRRKQSRRSYSTDQVSVPTSYTGSILYISGLV